MTVRTRLGGMPYTSPRPNAKTISIRRRKCRSCESVNSQWGQATPSADLSHLTPAQLKRELKLQEQRKQTSPIPQEQINADTQKPVEKKSIFQRFGEYVAKNQADLKAAGETSLMEDLSDAGKKMFNQAGTLGDEELSRIRGMSRQQDSGNDTLHRIRGMSRQQDSGNDTIDYMVGRGRGKK